MTIELDRSSAPLMRIKWEGQPTLEEMNRYFQDIAAMYRSQQPLVVLFDARHASVPTTAITFSFVSGLRANHALGGQYVRAAALIIDSPLIARAADSIRWVYQAPYPVKVYSSPDEAEVWLRNAFGHPSVPDLEL